MIILFGVYAFSLFTVGNGFSEGAPDFSCKDPSAFHTRKINDTHEGIIMPQAMSTSPYMIDVSAQTFRPGDRISVTLFTQDSEKVLRGFFIQTIQSDVNIRDLRRRAFGRFENQTTNERPSQCQAVGGVPSGGITHTNNINKLSVTVTWIAPATYNPGTVQMLATGVFNYDTYWTNIRSPTLTPTGYDSVAERQGRMRYTPTAAWYRWLQYVRQQPTNTGADVNLQSADTPRNQAT